MDRELTAVERAQIESSKEPGERCTHKHTRQLGIVKQKTDRAWLVWWGTSDNKPRMTWEVPEDLEPPDLRVWPENKEQGSPSGFMRTIDLRDKPKTNGKANGNGKAPAKTKATSPRPRKKAT